MAAAKSPLRALRNAVPPSFMAVTAAPELVPDPMLEQLAEKAHLVIPVGDFYQELKVISRSGTDFEERAVIPVRYVPMTGEIERQGEP